MKENDITKLNSGYLQIKITPYIAVRWYDIGLELEIPDGRLQLIRNECDHCDERCSEMLQIWLDRGPNVKEESKIPNWKNMNNAMCANYLNAWAEE